MYQRNPGAGTGMGQIGATVFVDFKRQIRLGFRLVNLGIGGGVNDQIGPKVGDDMVNLFRVGDVQIIFRWRLNRTAFGLH